jgi:hypothetical protein
MAVVERAATARLNRNRYTIATEVMQRLTALFLMVCAAVGAGYWLGRSGVPKTGGAEKAGDVAITQLQEENRRLRAERDALAKGSKPPPAQKSGVAPKKSLTGRGSLEVFSELQSQNLVSLSGPLIFPLDGKVTETFERLFGLTPAEKTVLQDAIDSGRRRLDELARAHTKATMTGDTMVVSTAPFDGGAEVYDALLDTFARTLGPERGDMFVKLSADQLGQAFHQFGAEQRTLTVTRENIPGFVLPMICVLDHHLLPGGGTATGSGRFQDFKKLKEWAPALAPFEVQISGLPVKPTLGPK